jgi:putative FmdB family regulatory protein
MPLYEYKCRQCGTVREVRHGFKESFNEPCTECGAEMARVFTPAGIVFKGSGFYVTDSRKSGTATGSSAAKDSDAKPAADKPAEAKTPETKSSGESSSSSSSEKSTAEKPSAPKSDSTKSGPKSDAAA